MKRLDPTVRDILFGALLYGVIVEIVGLIIVEQRLNYTLGILYGYLCVIFMTCHMYLTLEKALDMEPDTASKYSVRNSLLRYVITLLFLVVAVLVPKVSVIAVVTMLFGMKISAFLQPKIHKYMTSRIFKEGR